ncbi:MAG: hypothetical protein MZV65_25935 [Chromatiales bacterium]|nr:hypothetical protein [Chromatiales bacterium]
MTAEHLSQERVLETIAERFGHSDFSTRELAGVLGVTEPQVRGALGWLVHARVLHAVGGVRGSTAASARTAPRSTAGRASRYRQTRPAVGSPRITPWPLNGWLGDGEVPTRDTR